MQSNSEDEDTVTHRIVWHIRIIMIKTDTEQCWLDIYLTMHRTYGAYTNSVADPAFCGRGRVNFAKPLFEARIAERGWKTPSPGGKKMEIRKC